MPDYDYKADIQESCKLLPMIQGALVEKILINVVEPEYNVVYFLTDQGVFALQGEVGGEYLGIKRLDEPPEEINEDGYIICPYLPFIQFEGDRISQARQIGSAWNGHGFEFSFEKNLDKTMIVQSIYAGEKPSELEDCLRLGVAVYSNKRIEN